MVQAFAREPYEHARYTALNEQLLDANIQTIRGMASSFPLVFLIANLGTLAVIWFGGYQVIDGALSLGELVAFNSYLMMLAWPMIAFGWVTNLLQRGMASWKRMLEILDTPPDFIQALQLERHLSPTRSTGLHSMLNAIRSFAGDALEAAR